MWEMSPLSVKRRVEKPSSAFANGQAINLPNDLETQNCPFRFKEFLMLSSPMGTINEGTLRPSTWFPGQAGVLPVRPEGERALRGEICVGRGALAHFSNPPSPLRRRLRGVPAAETAEFISAAAIASPNNFIFAPSFDTGS